MDKIKLKISDILKYIIVGLIEVVIVMAIIHQNDPSVITDIKASPLPMQGNGFEIDEGYKTLLITVIPIATLAAFYLIGYITQSIIMLFLGGRLLGTGITEMARYLRYNPRCIIGHDRYPDWIHWSQYPDKVITSFQEHLEALGDNENKAEFVYSGQLFQGICFALILATPFTCMKGAPLWSIPVIIGGIFLVNFISRFWTQTPYIAAIAVVVIQFVMCYFHLNCPYTYFWPTCLAISFLFSYQLSKKQIIRFGILAKSVDEKDFHKILLRFGVPYAYILIRAHKTQYLDEALDSVAQQDYPGIKVIILIDSKSHEQAKEKIQELAESKRKEHNLNILCATAKKSGPAALAYEIRNIFVKYASENDIAIMLDSDDMFESPGVVTGIMTQMYRSVSDICLISFEVFGQTSLNYSMNKHNELVKDIACKDIGWDPQELDEKKKIHRLSTIGWTKCYRKNIVKYYQELLKEHFNKVDLNGSPYMGNTKYEDFPDIVTLLKKGTRICALKKTAIRFRKHPDSVTTSIIWDNYGKFIPYFLDLCQTIISKEKNQLIKEAEKIVKEHLIPYKITQYYNILNTDENVRKHLAKEGHSTTPEKDFFDVCTTSVITKEKYIVYLESPIIKEDLSILEIDKKELRFN